MATISLGRVRLRGSWTAFSKQLQGTEKASEDLCTWRELQPSLPIQRRDRWLISVHRENTIGAASSTPHRSNLSVILYTGGAGSFRRFPRITASVGIRSTAWRS